MTAVTDNDCNVGVKEFHAHFRMCADIAIQRPMEGFVQAGPGIQLVGKASVRDMLAEVLILLGHLGREHLAGAFFVALPLVVPRREPVEHLTGLKCCTLPLTAFHVIEALRKLDVRLFERFHAFVELLAWTRDRMIKIELDLDPQTNNGVPEKQHGTDRQEGIVQSTPNKSLLRAAAVGIIGRNFPTRFGGPIG